MNTCYEANASNDFTTFRFLSSGPKGGITKVVSYTKIDWGYYNLGFGDEDPETGEISDKAISNNNDSRKILETVTSTLYTSMELHPNATVVARGSSNSRTRLYQMGIANNLEIILLDFKVWGAAL